MKIPFNAYKELLADAPDIEFNAEPDHVRNCFWASTLVIGTPHRMTKARAIEKLAEMGLPGQPFFYPLSSLPAYPDHQGMGRQHNPVAYDVSDRGLSLPSAFNLTEQDIDRVCDGIRRLLA